MPGITNEGSKSSCRIHGLVVKVGLNSGRLV
jgi:hypothetical protein